jgi:hypothetical protein
MIVSARKFQPAACAQAAAAQIDVVVFLFLKNVGVGFVFLAVIQIVFLEHDFFLFEDFGCLLQGRLHLLHLQGFSTLQLTGRLSALMFQRSGVGLHSLKSMPLAPEM